MYSIRVSALQAYPSVEPIEMLSSANYYYFCKINIFYFNFVFSMQILYINFDSV